MCLVEKESGGDTQKVTTGLSSNRYGLFQISSNPTTGGCGKGYVGGKCNIRCECKNNNTLLLLTFNFNRNKTSALLTDGKLDDNIRCATTILQLNGFKDWKGWVNNCKGKIDSLHNIANC